MDKNLIQRIERIAAALERIADTGERSLACQKDAHAMFVAWRVEEVARCENPTKKGEDDENRTQRVDT